MGICKWERIKIKDFEPRNNYGKSWYSSRVLLSSGTKTPDANEDIECNFDDPGNNENENWEYVTNDSLEECLDNFDEEVENSKEATFLVGRTSRFGRAVKFNSNILGCIKCK